MADVRELLERLDVRQRLSAELFDETRAVIEAAERASLKPHALARIGTQRDVDLRRALDAWITRAREVTK